MTAPNDVAALVERCPKPGCGAQKIVGHPCYDWDCPQQTLTATQHQDAVAALRAENATQATTIAALQAEVERAKEDITHFEAEARRYAGFYPPHSDGRNTFVIFAGMIAARSASRKENTP